MDSDTVHKPLLSSTPSLAEHDSAKKNTSLPVSLARLALKSVMWAVFVSWVAAIFVFPAESSDQFLRKWIDLTEPTVFGITGSLFLMFSAPILVIAILAVAYLVISGERVEEFAKNKGLHYPRFRLWTFPVIVDGPFGVVSAAEFVGICLFAAYTIWAVSAYTVRAIGDISDQLSFKEQSYLFFDRMGLRLGSVGMYCLAFLFLPIARGSVLLQLIDIPFEHATRYHVWLGHLTMALFTLHGLFFVVAWAIEGHLLEKIFEWRDIGVANLAGVISLLAGLLMWVTSLPPVRKLNFELFFYTHQLYVIFVVFLALHVGDFIFCLAAGGIFIFMLDRFMRFCQSRKVVEILSAKCLPCGTIELTLSKPASLRYNALSFVFVQIRELSWLQWHPFSVSSSPLDGNYHMSVLIKVLGDWTAKLREIISTVAPPEEELRLTASVEGPYGHELPYHLTYENLVLVAGGIGISPFLAILSDVLRRIGNGMPCLPRNVSIIWAVKQSTELSLLSSLDTESIYQFFSDKLNVETHIYVTRESEAPLEEGNIVAASTNCPAFSPSKGGRGMSGLVGTGNRVWSGMYLIISTFGCVLLMGLLEVFYIIPNGISQWWLKGLLVMASMAVSIIVFGGSVLGLWKLWETRISEKERVENNGFEADNAPRYEISTRRQKNSSASLVDSARLKYGARPDFREIFANLSKCWGCVDAGVMVCGPPSLQASVAREIRSHNLRRERDQPVFHFHSHSFDL